MCGNILNICQDVLRSANLLHKLSFVDSQIKTTAGLYLFSFTVGDGTEPYPNGFELWDTVDNKIIKADLPPGYSDSTTFYRPVISNFEENSFLLKASRVDNGGSSYLDKIYQYNVQSGKYKL